MWVNERGPGLRTSIVVIAIGVALFVVGGVGVGVKFFRPLFGEASVSLPADIHRHFDTGDYEVWQRTGARQGGGGFSLGNVGPVTILPGDVVVSDSNGDVLPDAGSPRLAETLTRGSAVYTGAIVFSIPRAGSYDVRIVAHGGLQQAIITRSFGGAARAAAAWFVAAAAGGFTAFVGLVLLIVGVARRSRGPQPVYAPTGYYAAPPALPPPGWYPDPGRAGGTRWWDGSRWTDHAQ